ncbi:probable receptor-like protein kinase At5g38990 [Daucus carota subsp. sativus]|nr:PREDICTED: probable receptor-like protein kinase At5g38990 [Daucus carota subsp. sativus]
MLLTARVFSSIFTYKIPVSGAGQKFLRLYFYPTNYADGFDMTKSFFSVHAADQILVSNFSAFLNLQSPSLTLVKEYIITVNQSRLLDLTFIPSPNSSAFVNGIEVVSIPDKLYVKGNDDSNGIKLVGLHSQSTTFVTIDGSKALEKFYRLNVGGQNVSSTDDSGMFRSWDGDEPYLIGSYGTTRLSKIEINYSETTPPYTAPEIVYSTERFKDDNNYTPNITWIFPVDYGFYYLLRLYFCESRLEVTQEGQLVFDILVNNQTAEKAVDIIYWTGGRGIPIYKDYVVSFGANPDGNKSKTDLWLTMQPNKGYQYENTILNGLEIYKLSNDNHSLAAPNPLPPSETKNSGGIQNSGTSGASIGGSFGVIIVFLFILALLL